MSGLQRWLAVSYGREARCFATKHGCVVVLMQTGSYPLRGEAPTFVEAVEAALAQARAQA